jgi:D-alanine-D-alanine ligase
MQVIASLDKEKHKCYPVYLTKDHRFMMGKDLDKLETYKQDKIKMSEVVFTKKKILTNFKKIPIDVVINCVHGRGVEGGEIAGFFETLKIPYTSSNVLTSSICQDKIITKKLLAYERIPVVDFIGFDYEDWTKTRSNVIEDIKSLGFPVIAKAANLGSSIGISLITEESNLEAKIIELFKYDDRILVEVALENYREFNCSIIDNEIISVIEEVNTSNDLLTFNDKYEESQADRTIPAVIDEELENEIYDITHRVSKLLQHSGVSRIDYLFDNDSHSLFVNEVNTIPGSLAYYLYEDRGIYFNKLIDILIDKAIKTDYLKTQKTNSFKSNVLNMKGIKK